MSTSNVKTKKKPATPARRAPKWKCSEDTIKHIVTTTHELLAQDGLLKLSTNKIAKAAGISVGTIYQYFNNKEEIIAKLYGDRLEEVYAVVVSAMEDLGDDPTLPNFMKLVRSRIADSERALQSPFIETLNSLAIPEVEELNKQLSQRLAELFADFLLQAGSTWTRPKLVKLSYFAHAIYGAATWRAAARIGKMDKELEGWRDDTFELVLSQTLK